MDPDSEQLQDAKTACALRFDGYAYAQLSAGPDGDVFETLSRLSRRVVETLEFYADDRENFAAFFALQRFLGKWGGESLTSQARETVAFDLLFLHLYRRPTPEAFVNPSMESEWQEHLAAGVEPLAAAVRRSLRRVGDGPVVSL